MATINSSMLIPPLPSESNLANNSFTSSSDNSKPLSFNPSLNSCSLNCLLPSSSKRRNTLKKERVKSQIQEK